MLHLFGMWKRRKILCRASWRKRTTNKIFVVRFISGARQSFFKKNDASFGRSVEEKKYFVVRRGEKRTANKIFAVRFISDAWQSFF
jgi:hypothetical protein